MKADEVTLILKSLGWRYSNDEVGDKCAEYELSDRIVDMIYGLRGLPGEQQLWVMRSTSTNAFIRSCCAISQENRRYTPLVTPWRNPRISAPKILEEHIRKASDESIAWAQEQDLGQALRAHANLPTNVPGARPLWHLAALAVLGELTKLKYYQASFKAGDRLGFVNYISKDYIDRALSHCTDLQTRVRS